MPSPKTKPSRSRSNGREALVGSSLLVLRAVSRLNPVTPKGWIMLCVPPESITSASPRRMISTASPIALCCRRAGRQAVGVGTLSAEQSSQMPGGHVGFLLQFDRRVQPLHAGLGEACQIEIAFCQPPRPSCGRSIRNPAAPRRCPGRRQKRVGSSGRSSTPEVVGAACVAAPGGRFGVATAAASRPRGRAPPG